MAKAQVAGDLRDRLVGIFEPGAHRFPAGLLQECPVGSPPSGQGALQGPRLNPELSGDVGQPGSPFQESRLQDLAVGHCEVLADGTRSEHGRALAVGEMGASSEERSRNGDRRHGGAEVEPRLPEPLPFCRQQWALPLQPDLRRPPVEGCRHADDVDHIADRVLLHCPRSDREDRTPAAHPQPAGTLLEPVVPRAVVGAEGVAEGPDGPIEARVPGEQRHDVGQLDRAVAGAEPEADVFDAVVPAQPIEQGP